MNDSELFSYAKQLQVPIDLLRETAKLGRLPVVNFAAGGLGNVLQKKNPKKTTLCLEHSVKRKIFLSNLLH
jgi:pyridoxal biosynthesis lyase PdxS